MKSCTRSPVSRAKRWPLRATTASASCELSKSSPHAFAKCWSFASWKAARTKRLPRSRPSRSARSCPRWPARASACSVYSRKRASRRNRRPAVSCELVKTVLHGYLDGELDAAGAADFERHLISCVDCVAALEANENLRSSVQRAGLYERAPLALRQELQTQFSGATRSSVMPIRNPGSWRWLAVAATFLLAVFLGWRLLPILRGNRGETALASAIVDAHLRSLQPGHLEDVQSSDQHTVKPWFDGKLDFAPPVHDFVSEGFPLQGGRLDVVRGRTVAVLVYARRKHLINVFVWPTTEADSEPVSGAQLGYHWINWRKGGMEMCAVSDVSRDDLAELQRLLVQ